MRRSAWLVAGVALCLATPVAAAAGPGGGWAPPPGSKVRVSLSNGRTLRGRMDATTEDAVRIVSRGQPQTVPLSDIRALQLSTGARRNTARGALIAFGLIATLVAAQAAAGGIEETNLGEPEALLGLVGAAGVGAGVGALVKSDVWTTVTVPGGQHAAATFSRAITFRISLSF